MRDTQSIKSTQSKHTFSQQTNKTKDAARIFFRRGRLVLVFSIDATRSVRPWEIVFAGRTFRLGASLVSPSMFISFALGDIFRRGIATNFSFSLVITIIHKRRAGSAETIHR